MAYSKYTDNLNVTPNVSRQPWAEDDTVILDSSFPQQNIIPYQMQLHSDVLAIQVSSHQQLPEHAVPQDFVVAVELQPMQHQP